MSDQSVAVAEEQSVTFVELFFDLVFVFCVTQLVGILHHGFDWASVGQTVLVFWLVWWAWSQFTWALNSADTTHPWIEFATLLATGVAFFMAIIVSDAFEARSMWFALAYALVRAIGLLIYRRVSAHDATQAQTIRNFTLLSLGGLATVLLGAWLGGTAQYALWGVAIILDVNAARITTQGESATTGLQSEHFAERHGLFVIIALGEALIVAGSGITGEAWTVELLTVAILAVALTCGFWWSYFHQAKPALDRAFAAHVGVTRVRMAAKVYSVLHFPMLLGVIMSAFAIEEAIAHPDHPFSAATLLALALGFALFVGGMALCLWQAKQGILWSRLIVVAITVAAMLLTGTVMPFVMPSIMLAIALIGVLTVTLLEYWLDNPSTGRLTYESI